MQGVGIQRTIQKTKRTGNACDNCKHGKKKCDGNIPCSRCINVNKICIRKHKPKQVRNIFRGNLKEEKDLCNLSVVREHLHLYFKHPQSLVHFIYLDIDEIENPSSKALIMQFNCILAISTRLYSSNRDAYLSFEQRAKQLSGDLFDDFTLDTAISFQLLSYYSIWDSLDSFRYYQSITLSILKQLKKKNNSIEVNRMIGITLGLAPLDCINENLDSLIESYNVLNSSTNSYTPVQHSKKLKILDDNEFLEWSSIQIKLGECIFNENNNYVTLKKGTIPLTKIERNEIVEQIKKVNLSFSHIFDIPFRQEIVNTLLYSCIDYLSGLISESLDKIRNAIQLLQEYSITYSSVYPDFIILIDKAFEITYTQEEYFLSNQLYGYLLEIIPFIPYGIPIVDKITNLLHKIPKD